ncbi:MAG: hypothetical protein ABTQ27_10920 [Amaricoccus sp.]|uniref:hypothetical protein n=1 Tax=Amaricoccus sp. TaxID=1872485 RepID=UPI0033149DB4
MNLDKLIELIAEQVAREVLEGSEDRPDREEDEDAAMPGMLRRIVRALNVRENIWLTEPCRAA